VPCLVFFDRREATNDGFEAGLLGVVQTPFVANRSRALEIRRRFEVRHGRTRGKVCARSRCANLGLIPEQVLGQRMTI
jgi:hypothetical protein